MKRLFFLFSLALTAIGSYAIAAGVKYSHEVLASELQRFARSHADLSESLLRSFLLKLSNQEKKLPDFVQWPGEQFGVLLRDVDGDGRPDIIVAQVVSENRASLLMIGSKDDWSRYTIYRYSITVQSAIRHVDLVLLDLNNDRTPDLYMRFIEAGQRLFSIDCILIRSKGLKEGIDQQCFDQEASSNREDLVQSKLNKKLLQVSHIADLNGDGDYEIVHTSYFRPHSDCGAACALIWPDIYKWDGSKYVLADKEFPKYYRALEGRVEAELMSKGGRVQIDKGYKASLEALLVKISTVLPTSPLLE